MSKRYSLPVGAAIGVLVGLFASTLNGSAYAASGCLAAPNRESGPGTHWNYRIDQTTKQHCWYLKKVGGKSRPRPTSVAHATRSRVTRDVAATPSRAAPVEVAAPAENDSSVVVFAATFALTGSSAPTTGTREPAANEALAPAWGAPLRRSARRARPPARGKARKSAREATEQGSRHSSDQQSEWQRSLYEEFLQWR
jgi:hypothetical protein